MDTNQPSIPDFKQESSSPSPHNGSTGGNSHDEKSARSGNDGGNFTPLKKGKHFKINKKGVVIALTLLLAIIIPVTGYYVYNTTQTTDSSAATGGLCHNGTTPDGHELVAGCYACKLSVLQRRVPAGVLSNSNIFQTGDVSWVLAKDIPNDIWRTYNLEQVCPDPKLRDPDTGPNVPGNTAWNSTQGQCKAPGNNGMRRGLPECKKKGPTAYECSDGWAYACGLDTPTPTPFQKSECASPNTCVDTATAAAQGCIPPDTVADASLQCPLPNNIGVGYCCPTVEVTCEAPKTCIALPDGVDPSELCKEGTIDKAGSAACSTNGTQGICCEPPGEVTEPPTPTDEPEVTPTTPVTQEPSESPTPEVTQACVLPTLDIQVECQQCGDVIGVEQ